MANIALVGMTGNIGSRILIEALARGHRVTGTTRGAANPPARQGLTDRDRASGRRRGAGARIARP